MLTRPQVYIGYDPRQLDAYRACALSLLRHSPDALVHPISRDLLGAMYKRPTVTRHNGLWDVLSDAPMSTDFALARFFVPALCPFGWAVFVDCDTLWRAPVEELLAYKDDFLDVLVVQHDLLAGVNPVKMDGQLQTTYPRKNWSSVMLLNCTAINMAGKLDRETLNIAKGIELHGFDWVPHGRLGDLPPEWNYLVGVNPPMADPKLVHYTLGLPSLPEYANSPFADEWWSYAGRKTS